MRIFQRAIRKVAGERQRLPPTGPTVLIVPVWKPNPWVADQIAQIQRGWDMLELASWKSGVEAVSEKVINAKG